MDTFCFTWMNAGKPFDLQDRVSLDAYRSCLAAKSHALIEGTKGLTDALPAEVRAEVMATAQASANIAQMNVLIFDALCSVDEKVREVGMVEATRRIGIPDYTRMVKAMSAGLKAVTGEKDGARPLDQKPN